MRLNSSGLNVDGTVTATAFSGSGASLTTLNASNLSSGTVAYGRLPVGTGSSQVAQGSHNHDSTYLKLAGGTMTGDLKMTENSTSILMRSASEA